MSRVANFRNPEGEKWASWEHQGREVRIAGSGRILAEPTPAGKVVIVELDQKLGKDNAFVYLGDGTLEKVISNPISESICFDDVFFDGNELVLIAGSRMQRVAVVIDDNANFVRSYQTV